MTRLDELKAQKTALEAKMKEYIDLLQLCAHWNILYEDTTYNSMICDWAQLRAQITMLENQKPTFIVGYRADDTIQKGAGKYESLDEAVRTADRLLRDTGTEYVLIRRIEHGKN